MASTVNQAFTEFLRESVNLHPDDSVGAKASRAWLRGQLHSFSEKDSLCPLAYQDVDIDYGSFERRTKIRPLDDVDLIHGLSADEAYYTAYSNSDVRITTAPGSRLARYCHADGSLLNSRRVINKIISMLNDVPQYEDAAERDGVSARLVLASYDWSFDIVPGFFTKPAGDGRTFYVIPNGVGHWMLTDPRLDRSRVVRVNQAHQGKALNVVRLLKYWNRRPTMPSVPRYAFETLICDYLEQRVTVLGNYVDLEIAPALGYISSAIYSAIWDPKGIEGDLNDLEFGDRAKVATRAHGDAIKAQEAWELEKGGDQKSAIVKWGGIFGPAFPSFTN